MEEQDRQGINKGKEDVDLQAKYIYTIMLIYFIIIG